MRNPRGEDRTHARRVVPAYTLVGGRTRSHGRDLPIESMVTTTGDGLRAVTSLQFEERDIVLLCRKPQSIAEVAAKVRIPLGVARVLVSDLTAAGHLAVHIPSAERPERVVLERLLSGLRAR